MENVIALAVLDKHSSCSETSGRAVSRVRQVIPAAISGTVQGTALSSTGTATASTFGYVMPQTDDLKTALNQTPRQGDLTWSPPV